MPDLLSWITVLLGGTLSYNDVRWAVTLTMCLLLLVSGSRLLARSVDAGAGTRPGDHRVLVTLLCAVIGVSLASSWSGWLGIPDVADYLTPWHVLFTLWMLASVFPALAFFWAALRHKLIAALFGFMGLLLFVLLINASLRMSEDGVIAPAALLYVAPLAVGGPLLGWALASGRRVQALYVVAWFVLLATLGQGLYLSQMSAPMYLVERLSSVTHFSPEYAQSVSLVSEATWAQIWISGFYFVVSLAILMPLMRSSSGMLGKPGTSLGAVLTRLLKVHPDVSPGSRVPPHNENTHPMAKRA